MISNRIVWLILLTLFLIGLTSLVIATRFTFTIEAFQTAVKLYPTMLVNGYIIGFVIFWILGACTLAGYSATIEVPKNP